MQFCTISKLINMFYTLIKNKEGDNGKTAGCTAPTTCNLGTC